MTATSIVISRGIPPADQARAAALYWEAFGGKLGAVLGPAPLALAFIARVLRADHALCAHDGAGRLLGVAGFRTATGALVDGGFRDLRQIYGSWGAVRRVVMMQALIRDTDNTRFLLDGLFVAPESRGMGVGTALLQAMTQEAWRRGYHEIRLDVVDTNARAQALYLRCGFIAARHHRMGLWRHVFGFRSATTMIRRVQPEPISAPAANTSAPPSTT